MLTLKAYAKINLTLEVVGRRDDGYHDILSIFQTVDLHDTVTLEASDTLSLECDDSSLVNDDNLVLKAARTMAYRLRAPQSMAHTDIAKMAGSGWRRPRRFRLSGTKDSASNNV